MALALGNVNRFETGTTTPMYSYYQPVTSDIATHRHENGSTLAFSLDGANENREDAHDPYPSSDRYDPQRNDLNKPNLAELSDHGPEHLSADANSVEVDPNQSRRKRRKTTPVKDKSTATTKKVGRPKKTATNTISWFAQPTNSPNTQDAREENTSFVKTEDDKNDRSSSPHAAANLSCATDSQELEHSNNNITKSQVNANTMHIPSPKSQQSPSNLKGKASRPKNISLNNNGTLLSSPRTSPRSSRKKPEVARKLDPCRNVRVKNGKFVQSLPIVLRYGTDDITRQTVSERIEKILASVKAHPKQAVIDQSAKTHPFFLGKTAPKAVRNPQVIGDDSSSRDTDQEDGGQPPTNTPIPWKDIKFSRSKIMTAKFADSPRPIWPPRDMQHTGRVHALNDDELQRKYATTDAKQKTMAVSLHEDEDILHIYGCGLQSKAVIANKSDPVQKHTLSGIAACNMLDSASKFSGSCPAISNLRSKVCSGTSAFDRGEAGGQNVWSSKYAPSGWREVLQPSCNVLHGWLQSLAVHNVQSGVEKGKPRNQDKTARKKKRQSKIRDELDDFVVDSDDENDGGCKIPNAILITGPTGCGKTASVFAVAKELGFEIFEIHPGMRRSAKDIFDKVGDMTQNHLVQKGDSGSRSSSMPPLDTSGVTQIISGQDQPTMSAFMGPKKGTRPQKLHDTEATATKKEQKQSLILFEEVDIIFEEDKGFWTGVQSLIQHSKRPVVMTCNDISTVPLNDLGLHAILEFTPVSNATATEYLAYLVAAEGHIIDRTALSALYASKNCDLRASITELNLWCQMTVGSKYGGLDWMLQSIDGQPQVDQEGQRLRVFSQNTYRTGLDLLPQVPFEEEEGLKFVQNELDFTISEWYECAGPPRIENADTRSVGLQRFADIADARSALDIFDNRAAPTFAAILTELHHNESLTKSRENVTSLYIQQLNRPSTNVYNLVDALDPVMEEKPTFPPSQGRLAPSLDTASPCVAIDVAPYVRSIVAFDQRLEQYRDEVFGSQGKKLRNTRAARAAAEGRDKANTRTERWFPSHLDFDQVLQTGSSWPQWVGDYAPGIDSDMGLSPSTIDE